MQYILLILLIFIPSAHSEEIYGEWSTCNVSEGSIELYTTFFRKEDRYEILIFGKGKNCNDLYKGASSGIISSSKYKLKNNLITQRHIKDRILVFDEKTRKLMGAHQKCNFMEWSHTFDTSCTLNIDIHPELKQEISKVIKDRNMSTGRIYVKNHRLIEERYMFNRDGLFPSAVYNLKLFLD